ncbi:hypothetical protein BBF96_00110 [Anoxybacter fermentans]|uniref:FAD-dependent protein C-terminal domain-containing protein n=1 Tax=Anoxybacter fermentans TaxID=1323375 RepID=A0A3S9SUK2_9FIRM|nr:FAD-dependent monooxygenase [Anoxybacter fermentans]AZR71948.1 hypothetical protein BBF96_00110 [Anoxybacter fermentans]
MLRLREVKIPIDAKQDLVKAVTKKLKIKAGEIRDLRIKKRAIDARRKNNIKFVYIVDLILKDEEKILREHAKNPYLSVVEPISEITINGENPLTNPPIIVGAGPAGLFAALYLARYGYKPILLERGPKVEERVRSIETFWQKGELDPESNVQFGEGGAGTFSDGKLTTRVRDERIENILKDLVKAGAPEEILIDAQPHIGTDLLRQVIRNLREEIKKLGGQVRFKSKVTDLIIEDGQIRGVVINDNEILNSEVVMLAIGHSARDTYEMLKRRGVAMEPKPFSIGVRIEHPQEIVDQSQYGPFAGHPKLGPATYRLSERLSELDRAVYTFCMCPGGLVIASASEPGGVVTNGMSYHARNSGIANSALVVSVKPDDFPSRDPLAGVEFQRIWERKAFEMGGGTYRAPAQLLGDFLKDRPSKNLQGDIEPTYLPGVVAANLQECLPPYVVTAIKKVLPIFDRRVKGFGRPGTILTGVETRTSAPLRINRNMEMESISHKGLYPLGEGAGYAGGIMSAALDGLKGALEIMKKFAPFD